MRHWTRQGRTLIGVGQLWLLARAVPDVPEYAFTQALDRLQYPLWDLDEMGIPKLADGQRVLPEHLR